MSQGVAPPCQTFNGLLGQLRLRSNGCVALTSHFPMFSESLQLKVLSIVSFCANKVPLTKHG